MHGILLQLQTKKVVTAQEIATFFDVSERTVYRDIRSLEESGVPIGAEAGVGYYLCDNYTLPPVMFTREEAFALITAGSFLKGLGGDVGSRSFDEALFKVKAIMPCTEKERLAELETKIEVRTSLGKEGVSQESKFLYDIQNALADNNVITIRYRSGGGDVTTRSIEPLSLCYYMMKWHLIAHCNTRNDIRDFRLDRIESLQFTGETFQPHRFSLDQYFQSSMQKAGWQDIELLVQPSLMPAIENSKYWYGFFEQHETPEGIVMRFFNPDLHYFARWVLTLGNQVQITAPDELKNAVNQLVMMLMRHYGL
jgi:predicted DNA-binding transcriptional regulator YafY